MIAGGRNKATLFKNWPGPEIRALTRYLHGQGKLSTVIRFIRTVSQFETAGTPVLRSAGYRMVKSGSIAQWQPPRTCPLCRFLLFQSRFGTAITVSKF